MNLGRQWNLRHLMPPAFLVASLALAAACDSDGRDDETTPTATSMPTPEASADSPLIATLDEYGGPEIINIVDPGSGRVLTQLDVTNWPMVLLRPSQNQVLLADASSETLRVIELANPNRPGESVAMPGVDHGRFYIPLMALSNDERYLYYSERTSVCPLGGDASVCDVHWIRAIDLDRMEEVAREETPGRCFPDAPMGESDLLLLCGAPSAAVRMTPRGGFTTLAEFAPAYIDALFTADGHYFVVTREGDVYGEDGLVDDLLSGGRYLGYLAGIQLDSERYLHAYSLETSSDLGSYHDGLVVISDGAPLEYLDIPVEFDFRHLARIDAETVALLGVDGMIRVFDVASQSVVREFEAPAGAAWLVGD